MIALLEDMFGQYELLTAKADGFFRDVAGEYGDGVRCGVRCSDCCSSVFGLFLIESVYLSHHFSKLDRRRRREALSRSEKADRQMLEVQKKLQECSADPETQARAMAKERVRCPLLGADGKCVLYAVRPLTCRVYGIPTLINGETRCCWKAGFEKGRSYPVFDLDGAYRELYGLSRAILERFGHKDTEDRASLLLSVSKSIKTPVEELIKPYTE
ncbi:MAG: hypothetical protein ACOY31_09450 [Bacillota bacterium]